MSLVNSPYKLAYFVSHPIQYQAPLLKFISAHPDIDLTVFFLTDISTKAYHDHGFGRKVEWDTPLLEGYEYTFLDSTFKKQDFGINNPSVSFKSIHRAILSNDWDAIWVHGYSNLALLFVFYLCKKNHIPVFLRGDSNLSCEPSNPIKQLLKRLLIKPLIKRFDALLCTGTANRNYYLHYGAKKEQLFSMPLAVDNQAFQKLLKPPKNPTSTENKIVFLYASKFIARKHPLLLLKAFNALNKSIKQQCELWFIGSGEQENELISYIKKYDLQGCVKLLGFKNQSELPWYFQQCDVFVLPAEREPFGLVINEVMNQAKAIITTTEVGASKDLVFNGDNGWIITAGSQTALTATLAEAAQRDDLEAMGQRSLSIISAWNFQSNIDGLLSALDACQTNDVK